MGDKGKKKKKNKAMSDEAILANGKGQANGKGHIIGNGRANGKDHSPAAAHAHGTETVVAEIRKNLAASGITLEAPG